MPLWFLLLPTRSERQSSRSGCAKQSSSSQRRLLCSLKITAFTSGATPGSTPKHRYLYKNRHIRCFSEKIDKIVTFEENFVELCCSSSNNSVFVIILIPILINPKSHLSTSFYIAFDDFCCARPSVIIIYSN